MPIPIINEVNSMLLMLRINMNDHEFLMNIYVRQSLFAIFMNSSS